MIQTGVSDEGACGNISFGVLLIIRVMNLPLFGIPGLLKKGKTRNI
jgi:hypothetical protein